MNDLECDLECHLMSNIMVPMYGAHVLVLTSNIWHNSAL